MSQQSGIEVAPGLLWFPGYLDTASQTRLLFAVRQVLAVAPLFQPCMPRSGKPMSVRMSNCGDLGWTADSGGYRYTPTHPRTGRPWPPMPPRIEAVWRDLADYPLRPQACLINYYTADARMGLHQDRDEADLDAPVLSLSLGDSCVFRFGGTQRRGATRSLTLASGDAIVLGGPARLAFHGVDRILGGSSSLLAEGGRFNLTARRVAAAP